MYKCISAVFQLFRVTESEHVFFSPSNIYDLQQTLLE